jgi:hypothetical protein
MSDKNNAVLLDLERPLNFNHASTVTTVRAHVFKAGYTNPYIWHKIPYTYENRF